MWQPTTEFCKIHTRVRGAISNLDYSDLVRDGVIPDIASVFQEKYLSIYATKKYPPFCYKSKDVRGPSYFGMLIDIALRYGVRKFVNSKVNFGECVTSKKLRSKNLNTVLLESDKITSEMYGVDPYPQEHLNKWASTFTNICKTIASNLNKLCEESSTICYEVEWFWESIIGHPDIVLEHKTHNTILDIKTTTFFKRMEEGTCLQILAYAAISPKPTKMVGVVLPIQREVITVDVSEFDFSTFRNVLLGYNRESYSGAEKQYKLLLLSQFRIGNHTTLKDLYTDNYRKGVALQLFLRNTRSGRQSKKTFNPAKIVDILTTHGLEFYTHAPYCINLCQIQNDVKKGSKLKEDLWAQRYLCTDLKDSVSMGFRGVVVHTGAKLYLDEEVALDNMENNVRLALKFATEECPLLLESPCGEGTEVCTTIWELITFFNRFTQEEKAKLGLCVDSCHVFASGYDPIEYLNEWVNYSDVPIKLVHFNDSRGTKGSRVDRHATPGTGFIGVGCMLEVAQFCTERNISMVVE